jgi:hypothetical protein
MSDNKLNRQEELDAIVDNEVMLTTIDNPYNPFSQWREWYAYDVQHGYNSSALLARIAITSNELSEADQALAINQAIDEIIEFNLSGKHIKVTKDDYPKKMKTIMNIQLLKEN